MNFPLALLIPFQHNSQLYRQTTEKTPFQALQVALSQKFYLERKQLFSPVPNRATYLSRQDWLMPVRFFLFRSQTQDLLFLFEILDLFFLREVRVLFFLLEQQVLMQQASQFS